MPRFGGQRNHDWKTGKIGKLVDSHRHIKEPKDPSRKLQPVTSCQSLESDLSYEFLKQMQDVDRTCRTKPSSKASNRKSAIGQRAIAVSHQAGEVQRNHLQYSTFNTVEGQG